MDPALLLKPVHRRRLREVWRSAGWPYQDLIEAELLAAGLLARERDAAGRDTVRVSDTGVAAIAQTLRDNRAARSAHEALVEAVARELQRHGRLVWRGLSLRAPLASVCEQEGEEAGTRWVMAVPDVFSIRQTTREDRLEPSVHEIKVRRADLLADLKRPDKRAAYLALAGECWYVLAPGVGDADDVPAPHGVLRAAAGGLELLRPAERRVQRPGFMLWMALARAAPDPVPDDEQSRLGGPPRADAGSPHEPEP